MINIKMFGSLRLKTGFKGATVDYSEVSTVKEACEYISGVTGKNVKEFHNCNYIVNGKMVKPNAKLADGDELVLMAASGGG